MSNRRIATSANSLLSGLPSGGNSGVGSTDSSGNVPPPPPPPPGSGGDSATNGGLEGDEKTAHENTMVNRFVVNIKLSAGKLVPIVIYDDCTALELATNFGRIHALDAKAVEVLASVLQQHMGARRTEMAELPHQ